MAHFRTRCVDAHAAFGRRFDVRHRCKIFLSRTREASAVEKRCESDSAFDGLGWILTRKAFALRSVVAQFKSTLEEFGHINFFVHNLPDRERLALSNEIAAAEFIGRQANSLRYLI